MAIRDTILVNNLQPMHNKPPKDHIHGFTPMEHKIIHEVKLKMDSGAGKQQEVEGHDGLHLMRPLIDPITGQEMEGTQTQETGDALYNFTGNFAGASAGAQGQGSSNAGLKEAMECHYGDYNQQVTSLMP
ncbi:uncharacterized protein LOC135102647 isoform X4 [Scylla paramamosain]|uniref:uncharacterized protein LOC135102647 isoform X4 n=1 Tax=Scylla paramamosain TaxID=85552 RepID=UPI0030827510